MHILVIVLPASFFSLNFLPKDVPGAAHIYILVLPKHTLGPVCACFGLVIDTRFLPSVYYTSPYRTIENLVV